jgi:hypothetical protein
LVVVGVVSGTEVVSGIDVVSGSVEVGMGEDVGVVTGTLELVLDLVEILGVPAGGPV